MSAPLSPSIPQEDAQPLSGDKGPQTASKGGPTLDYYAGPDFETVCVGCGQRMTTDHAYCTCCDFEMRKEAWEASNP